MESKLGPSSDQAHTSWTMKTREYVFIPNVKRTLRGVSRGVELTPAWFEAGQSIYSLCLTGEWNAGHKVYRCFLDLGRKMAGRRNICAKCQRSPSPLLPQGYEVPHQCVHKNPLMASELPALLG